MARYANKQNLKTLVGDLRDEYKTPSWVKDAEELGNGLEVSDGTLSVNATKSSDGPVDGPISELSAEGWAEQFSTTGKNLLDPSGMSASSTRNGITFTNHGDGSFSVSGTSTAEFAIAVIGANSQIQEAIKDGGTFTLSCDKHRYDMSVFNFSIRYREPDADHDSFLMTTRTLPANCTVLGAQLWTANGATIDTVDHAHFQLELGSTATEYEPYTGGAPSPSPDYPQEIEVAKGRNLLDINSQEKTGPRPSTTIRNNIDGHGTWIGFARNNYYSNTAVSDVSISDGKLTWTQNADIYGVGFECSVSPNTLYTITVDSKSSDYISVGVGFYDSVGSYIDCGFAIVSLMTKMSGSFTTPANCAYVMLVFAAWQQAGTHYVTNPQLTLGSTPQPYVPYGYVGMEVRDANDQLLSTTPIPLPERGWVGSLPDGTADILHLDGAGKVEWELETEETTTAATDGVTGTVGTDVLSTTGQIADGATVLYKQAPATESLGYIDLPDIPEGSTVSIRELDNLGVKYCIDPVASTLARQWYERAYAELGDAVTELAERVAALEQ